MRVTWYLKDLVEIAKGRQKNEFDCNIAVTGARGDGKSSFAFKFLSRFKGFRPWKHLVYSRKEVMKLLEKLKCGNIQDDEAIKTAYKRKFADPEQQKLIQMLNLYRDNFNIYIACIPNFYSLDKDLRDLFKIHIQIIERGLGVVHFPNENSLYSEDKWDIKYNRKVEESWAKRKQNNLNFRPKYSKLTTYRGYIKIPKLTPRQEALYKEIKETKRKIMYEEENKEEGYRPQEFYERLLARIREGKMTKEVLEEVILANGLKYSAVSSLLNVKLKDSGIGKTLSEFLVKKIPTIQNKNQLPKDIYAYNPE